MMGYEIRLAGGNSTNEGRVEVKGNFDIIFIYYKYINTNINTNLSIYYLFIFLLNKNV